MPRLLEREIHHRVAVELALMGDRPVPFVPHLQGAKRPFRCGVGSRRDRYKELLEVVPLGTPVIIEREPWSFSCKKKA